MDSGRLPAYRSSYLLRFHPYPRIKPSARERILASAQGESYYDPLGMSFLRPEKDMILTLNEAVHGTDDHIQLCQRRLSMSSLVVDLALLLRKESS